MSYTDIGQAMQIVDEHKQTIDEPTSVSNEALNAFLLEVPVLKKRIAAAIDEGITRLKQDPTALQDWQLNADPYEHLTRKK
jgi:uncharacterized small protein (DUF1192 family)